MKIDTWLNEASNQLLLAGVSSARLDCLLMLEHVSGKDRGYILAHPNDQLTKLILPPKTVQDLERMIQERLNHKPMAYILQSVEFYGRDFFINEDVLVPRPESETMIEQLLAHLALGKKPPGPKHIIDVGCGSGALGITACLEIPSSTLELIDIDPKCLKVARKNLELHKVSSELVQGNLLDKFSRSPNIVLANLPYVPDHFTINQAAMNEPKHAIFGGHDGLDLYRDLFKQLENFSNFDLVILTESLPTQHKVLQSIAKLSGFKQKDYSDFIQTFVR